MALGIGLWLLGLRHQVQPLGACQKSQATLGQEGNLRQANQVLVKMLNRCGLGLQVRQANVVNGQNQHGDAQLWAAF
jgi:hypothetical protein